MDALRWCSAAHSTRILTIFVRRFLILLVPLLKIIFKLKNDGSCESIVLSDIFRWASLCASGSGYPIRAVHFIS